MNRVLALILAGGKGDRLSVLSEKRTKPAVPFAGRYRIIDFTLSNCVNSDIYNVAVLTQYRPRSLNEHIGVGKPWDLDRATGGIHLLQPYLGRGSSSWYQGTADAVYQNLNFVWDQHADEVLVLSGDHVYRMDYGEILDFHRDHNADVTIAVMEVPIEEATRFGTLIVDAEGQVVEFEEKPERPRSNLVSMGIYVFKKNVLFERLEEDAENPTSAHDFGKNVIPMMVRRDRVFTFTFRGYWRDVGTLQSYWEANMDLLKPLPEFDLYDKNGVIHTQSEERPPAKLGTDAMVRRSLICDGCIVEGEVYNSVLSPGVHVCRGAVIQDSIVMNDTYIEEFSTLDHAILDKNILVGRGSILGFGEDFSPNRQQPRTLNTGLTVIGRGTEIPSNVRIGRNCIIGSDVMPEDFPTEILRSGETIASRRRLWWMETSARGRRSR